MREQEKGEQGSGLEKEGVWEGMVVKGQYKVNSKEIGKKNKKTLKERLYRQENMLVCMT